MCQHYHVVFDDNFITVLYIESGTIPPNWGDIIKYSLEMATAEYINLEDTWLNGPPGSVGAKDNISDPFAVVTYYHKLQKTNTTGFYLPKPNLI